ncbi:MAG: hypothetical protein OJF50_002775 [Nitrospira sp.]|nr:hypothetical protein [Nitrospira sp.]
MDRFVVALLEPSCETWRKVRVHEKFHRVWTGTIVWFR